MSAHIDTSLFGIHEAIILTRSGTWLSNGEEITHPNTQLAFARNIYRCKDGHEIRLGSERKIIHVEDTIYFVTGLDGDPLIGYTLRLNDGRKLELDPASLWYRPGRLTCRVPHPNEGTVEEAKFLSTAYYEILKHLEKTEEGFGLTIEGKKITLYSE
ncbi:hypothetical protein EB061_00535 [bacterium]|jgi:hypothetical protein|nr:hypothetical protein [bacterium]